MSVVQIIQSLLCLELDDIFIINYVNNPACFWVCAQTVTWCYSFCGFVVGNCSGTIPRVLNFFLKYFEIETFIHISSCGPCILTILYFWWSIKTWNTVTDFGDLRPLVRVPVYNLWHYSANFIGFKCAD